MLKLVQESQTIQVLEADTGLIWKRGEWPESQEAVKLHDCKKITCVAICRHEDGCACHIVLLARRVWIFICLLFCDKFHAPIKPFLLPYSYPYELRLVPKSFWFGAPISVPLTSSVDFNKAVLYLPHGNFPWFLVILSEEEMYTY